MHIKMQNPLLILSALTCFYGSIQCSNILAIVPVNSRSHFIVMEPLFKALAQRGHQITVVSTYPQTKPLPNYTDIDVSNLFPTKGMSFSVDFIKENLQDIGNCIQDIAGIGYNTCEAVYSDKRITQLLNSSGKFDVVITEIFSTDCFVFFAHKFNVPLISMMTSVSLPWSNDRIGNPDNPSYIVNYFYEFNHQMTLYERALNTATLIYAKVMNYYLAESAHLKLMRKIFDDNVPELHEIYNMRTALILVNSHFTITQSRPMVPNFIEIGGIHMQQSAPLPKDLQEMLDDSKSGFILFSMGTLVNMTTMPQHVLTYFLDAFSSFESIVLWKYDGKLPYYPKNVITRKWLPQQDILVHKNLKIFITHGGLSSTLEVVNAGVPIIGIPMFADQKANVMNVVRRGAGILLDYNTITTEKVATSITKILQDKSYEVNATKLSLEFKDRPLSALDSAVFWTEHVLRHKGSQHMRSAAADLPLYKLILLDVIVLFLLATILTCLLSYKIVLCLLRLTTEKQTTAFKTSKKCD